MLSNNVAYYLALVKDQAFFLAQLQFLEQNIHLVEIIFNIAAKS
jgi:hypothetical protein